MRAPTRALIVEDIGSWIYTFNRAARRAGASEVVACESLQAAREALRTARFDVAILDIGLDPDDDQNSDGIRVLEAIRETDGDSTRCILVTGWQGGDRMDLQSYAQQKFGVDWAFMKEKYDARSVIAKLTELLEGAAARRLAQSTPMANLGASMEPFLFEGQVLDALSPSGGVQTLYSLASRLLSSVIPLLAEKPARPMEKGPDGVCVGVYWSRTLSAAVAVGLAPADRWPEDAAAVPASLSHLLPAGITPDLLEAVRVRDVAGRLWELPGLDRISFSM
ncbi:MAG TPA: response regulator [Mycobacteriales bacterium]|nr:response regulator [Mycobacteriales bacterium]